jgi:hypothetical protein
MIGPAGFGQAPNTGVGRGLAARREYFNDDTMSKGERQERARLQSAWARGKATKKQILRCMELDSAAEYQSIIQVNNLNTLSVN